MIVILAGVPALLGALAIWVGVQQILGGLQYTGSVDIIAEIGAGILPITIGIGLLLVARGIARKTRLGYLVGLVASIGFVVLASWFITTLIPHLNDAGEWNLAPAFLMFAVGALLLTLGFIAVLVRRRAMFAESMTAVDRRLAITLAAVVVIGGSLSLGLGTLQGQVADQTGANAAQAEALVAATTVEVRVIDATLDAASTPPVVQHLTLELTIRSTTPFQLDRSPELCLTDLATYHDAGKAGVFCWGAAEPGYALDGWLTNESVTPDGATIRVDLDGGNPICPYSAGTWSAAVRLQPHGAGETLWNQTSFTVSGGPQGSASVPGGSVPEPAACTGLSK